MAGSQARRALCIFLTLLTLFLVGTVVVLTTVVQYFGVDSRDVITEAEMRLYERLADAAALGSPSNPSDDAQDVLQPEDPITTVPTTEPSDADLGLPATDDGADHVHDKRDWVGSGAVLEARARIMNTTMAPLPKIPKIVHQTWKTDSIPERWGKIRQACMDLHPDYEYMLWTDDSAREFIATNYPWFLSTFDGYTYPIQRADAIRYFVLHFYGGVYMDLDIGCRRSMDPLLYFEVVLPATIPVGVSNDLMFAAKGHPFMDLVIHNLVTFDHHYGTNYPTVMFSTGPMFLSAMYGMWPKDDLAVGAERAVRVLPRRWYGKNAPAIEMGDSYFTHFYGSSWHADDAGFITFLGKFGMGLMYLGLAVVVIGMLRLLWSKRPAAMKSPRPTGPIALPFHVPNDITRPNTPGGSRPDSPFGGSRSSTPVGPRRESGRGVLYYLPVWFMPPGERGPSSPTQPSGWTSYLPSFDHEGDQHRYQPIPNFSRPPSPSNNSILHAPGAHDGAFSGVHLHSISPRASASAPSAPSTSSPIESTPPPAYSTLRTWGSSFFRPFSSPKSSAAPILPFSAASATPHSSHANHSRHASRSRSRHRRDGSAPRDRTPSPPPHSRTPRSPSPYPGTVLHRPIARPASAGNATGGADGRPHDFFLVSHTQFRQHEPRPASMVRTSSTGGRGDLPTSHAATPHNDGSTTARDPEDTVIEQEASDGGRALVDEVDRLLTEMEPDFEGKEQ